MAKRLRLLLLSLIFLCFSTFPLPVWADGDINVSVDNNSLAFDVPPTIINGRTLVPLRIIFESLGANVQWDSTTQSITGIRDNITISLQVDNPTASRNGETLVLDVPAIIIENRTLVPARFIAESLGAEVNWNRLTNTVEIESKLPYNLSKSYILESSIKQLTSTLDETFYQEFETAIRNHFKPESYVLLEAYLRRTYLPVKSNTGIFIGPTTPEQTQGIYEWTSGGKYVGDWKAGSLEGKGAYYWPDGRKYIGEWKNNQRNGWGILYTSNGDIYLGEWLNNNMEGQGSYYWANGESYIGQWKNDEHEGLGFYSWPDGSSYKGELASGRRNGRGIFTYEDGERYLGQYSAGIKQGEGVYYWKPDFSFRGEYSDDKRTWGTYQGPGGILLNLQANAQQIVSEVVKPGMTSLAKLKALHDYVALQTKYDRENFQSNTLPAESHTAYGLFVNQKAVCDGYAEALHSLLQEAEIESWIVQGEAKGKNNWEGHAWLIVKINDKYSHVDVTWADLDQGNSISYDYFLISDEEISADHKWDTSLYPPFP